VKCQTVLPKQVREALQIGPGDTLRYRITEHGVVIDKVLRVTNADDPFAMFTEWPAPPTTRPMAISDGFTAYDVVIVPFPYVDRLAERRRPALVISSAALARHGVLWVAMITSAANASWTCDVPIADLERAGLPAPSVVRPAKIACIEPGRVVRRAGSLDARNASLVAGRLAGFLAKKRAPAR